MRIACLDLEGVLAPEIWVALAERTGVDALRLTTRDVPDYGELMARRLAILDERGLRLADLRAAAGALAPLAGAAEFLDRLRARAQVAVLSDTFYELAGPLMARLGNPMLFCHGLEVDGAGRVAGWRPRQDDPKRRVVAALQGLNARVAAAGDSYNDVSMLRQADAGFLFRPSGAMARAHPEFPVRRDYAALARSIEEVWDGHREGDAER